MKDKMQLKNGATRYVALRDKDELIEYFVDVKINLIDSNECNFDWKLYFNDVHTDDIEMLGSDYSDMNWLRGTAKSGFVSIETADMVAHDPLALGRALQFIYDLSVRLVEGLE